MFKTKDGKSLNVELLGSEEVVKILDVLQPNFTKAIKRCKNIDFSAYKVDYPFGAAIIKKGKIYLPLSDGASIALNDSRLPDKLARDLNYNPETEDPLILVLSKKSESFYLTPDNTVTSNAIIEPGAIIGIPRATYVPQPDTKLPKSSLSWELNAGARSLFMLSKIADKSKYDKLSKYLKVKIDPPTFTENQYDVLVNVANQCGSSWRCSVLFFKRKFIEQITEEENMLLSSHLMHRQRVSYSIWHNSTVSWAATFNYVEKDKNLNFYAPYVLHTARQLLYIGAEGSIGFKPATNDDCAPITFFQEAFENGYGLLTDNQSSVIMEPTSIENGEPVYYSLNYPILAEHKPDTFKGKSQITLLDQVSKVAMVYKSSLTNGLISNIPADLLQVAAETDFTFYHASTDAKSYKNIQNSSLLAEEDTRFLFNQKTPFAENSSFFKGCIKIIRKKHN